ncbi:MAG: hypothetical protein PHY56_08265, partial [Candidatus Omnitrophica bacterium]|nr:hypothetical protein [Candidatus Omnitrophota bacterium]
TVLSPILGNGRIITFPSLINIKGHRLFSIGYTNNILREIFNNELWSCAQCSKMDEKKPLEINRYKIDIECSTKRNMLEYGRGYHLLAEFGIKPNENHEYDTNISEFVPYFVISPDGAIDICCLFNDAGRLGEYFDRDDLYRRYSTFFVKRYFSDLVNDIRSDYGNTQAIIKILAPFYPGAKKVIDEIINIGHEDWKSEKYFLRPWRKWFETLKDIPVGAYCLSERYLLEYDGRPYSRESLPVRAFEECEAVLSYGVLCRNPKTEAKNSSPVVLAHSSWLIAHSPSATSYQLRAKVSSSPLAADGLTKASRGSLWSPVEQSRTKSSELRAKSSSPVNRLAEPAKLPTVWDIYAYRHEISEQFLYIKFCIKEKTDSEDYAFELDQLALELFVLLFDIEEQKDSPDIMLERLKEKLQQLDNLLINLETPGAVETKHHRATLRLRKIINNMLIGMSSRVKVRRTDIMPILLKEIAEMSDSDPKKLFIQYPKELIADVDVKVFSQALIELIEGGWIKEGIAVISVSQLSNEALIDITINLEEKNINADDIDVEDDKEFLKGLSGDYKITGDAKECGAVIHQMIKANGGAVEIINFNKELKIRFRLPSSISPNTTGEYNVVQAKAVLGRLGGHDIGFHTALSQIFAQNINEINYNLAREFRIDAKIRKVVNEMPGEWLDLDNTLSSLQLELEHGDNLETMIKSKLPVAVIEYITEKIIKALEDGDFFTEVFLTKVLFPESELSERLMDFCKNNKGLVSSPVVQDRTKSSEIRAKNSSPEEEQIGRIIVRLLPYSSTQITSDLIGKFQVFLLGINFAEFQRQATELENNDVDGWEGLIKRFIDVAYPYF